MSDSSLFSLISQVISRKPKIDSLSTEGEKPAAVAGRITFNNINFTYPTRPDEQILYDFSLDVPAKKTVCRWVFVFLTGNTT